MHSALAFVKLQQGRDGIGKLLSADATTAEIEYFESPIGPQLHTVTVPTEQVVRVELSAQTRVFHYERDLRRWRVGRVDGGLVSAAALRATEDHYHVRFPNQVDARIPLSQLYVRCERPLENPAEFLAGRTTETPYFADGRTTIARYLAEQRSAFGGLTALASSSVDLLEHQVTTIRRVLADPIERYLLADEVGLGKTVEAGVLVRQHLLDAPDTARVLVVVPPHLVMQWATELEEKFRIAPGDQVSVVSEDELVGSSTVPSGISMLVVDEVHRAALRAFDSPQRSVLYERLRNLALSTPRVLLLSGTPVLNQEDGFLAMLHLLDPGCYPLGEREAFRRRVRDRQAIADAMADLSDDASTLFVEDALEALERLFSDDARLMALCANLRAHVDESEDSQDRRRSLRSIRSYIGETYRLHRRLLRTRRDDPRVRDHLPRRTGATVLQCSDDARSEAFDFLESWRLGALDNAAAPAEALHGVLIEWANAAFSHPRVLLRGIEGRIKGLERNASEAGSHSSSEMFDGELALLRERHRLIEQVAQMEPRAVCVADWLGSNPDVKKAVVFVDDADIADEVARVMGEQLGKGAVLRHESSGSSTAAFESAVEIRALVCDAAAEEGLNLQRVGPAIIHYDLPLAPARLEQRIGRVDRIEARGRMRNVVVNSACRYENEWLNCLLSGVRVFERSVAPLQYALLEATARIRRGLLTEGRAAVEAETARLQDPKLGLDAELRRIRAQEALDSVEFDPDVDSAFFDALDDADAAAEETGADALHAWVGERLQFRRRPVDDGEGLRYVYSRSPRRPTLVPLHVVLDQFAACIDYDPAARRSSDELPLRAATFDRVAAQDLGLCLMRVGHPFLTALERSLSVDDRGRSFAMWRYRPEHSREPELYFRFDFIVEADETRVLDVAGSQLSSPEAVRRLAARFFPARYASVWLDRELRPVDEAFSRECLERPYVQQRRSDGGRDVNLRDERWEAVDALVEISDWTGLCERARARAQDTLWAVACLKDAIATAVGRVRARADYVADTLRSRVERLSGSARAAEAALMDFELALHEGLVCGIKAPRVRLDCAGCIFVAGVELQKR